MIGITMILVVIGHHSFPFSPRWYNDVLHPWIYLFHMEMFIFLSSFLIRYSYRGVHSVGEYLHYIGRKLVKFLIPFLVIGITVSLANAWVNGIPNDEIGRVALSSLRMLLLYPMTSDASFLWYIYVLFGFYLISPIVFRLPRWVQMTLCTLSIGLPLLHPSHLLGAYLFCKYAFFYFLGILCATGWIDETDSSTPDAPKEQSKPWLWVALATPFVIWSILLVLTRTHTLDLGSAFWTAPSAFHLIEPCLAIVFFYALSRLIIRCHWITRLLSAISRDCYWIYLLSLFISWLCAYLLAISGWGPHCPFWLFLLFSTTMGIAVPMALERLSRHLPNRRKRK